MEIKPRLFYQVVKIQVGKTKNLTILKFLYFQDLLSIILIILPYQTFLFFWQDLTAPLQQKYHSHHLQILQYFWFSPNSRQNLLLVLQNFALSPSKKLQPSVQNFSGIPNIKPFKNPNHFHLNSYMFIPSTIYIIPKNIATFPPKSFAIFIPKYCLFPYKTWNLSI